MAISIWKDTYYETSADNSPFSYSITVDTGGGNDETIFQGKAYVAPDESTIKIHVNEICKDYLHIGAPAFKLNDPRQLTMTNTLAARRFYLKHNGSIMEAFDFVLDWSYDKEYYSSASAESQAHPVNGHLATNMYQMYTQVNGNSRVSTTYTARGNYSLSGSLYHGDYCGKWALYYVNSYGGWDAYLIEGSGKRIDDYNRLTINSRTDTGIVTGNYTGYNTNDSKKVFGRNSYNNLITPSWELKTGFVSDTEAENIAKNLLRSNKVILHDLDKDMMYPVVLSDTQGEWKTYRNSGRKFISYTITAQGAQTEQNLT